MAGDLQCDEQKKYTAENPLSSKSVIQNRRRDKSLPKQKLKKFITTKPALQVILRGDSVSEMLQGPQSTRDITTSLKPTDITVTDRKSTRLNSSHRSLSRMPSSA